MRTDEIRHTRSDVRAERDAYPEICTARSICRGAALEASRLRICKFEAARERFAIPREFNSRHRVERRTVRRAEASEAASAGPFAGRQVSSVSACSRVVVTATNFGLAVASFRRLTIRPARGIIRLSYRCRIRGQ